MDVEPGLESKVDQAAADLAARTGRDRSAITVVSARAVVWPDTSLGCPQPGMRYLQVPQDGTHIVLELEGHRYEYHSGGDRSDPFLCEPPSKN